MRTLLIHSFGETETEETLELTLDKCKDSVSKNIKWRATDDTLVNPKSIHAYTCPSDPIEKE